MPLRRPTATRMRRVGVGASPLPHPGPTEHSYSALRWQSCGLQDTDTSNQAPKVPDLPSSYPPPHNPAGEKMTRAMDTAGETRTSRTFLFGGYNIRHTPTHPKPAGSFFTLKFLRGQIWRPTESQTPRKNLDGKTQTAQLCAPLKWPNKKHVVLRRRTVTCVLFGGGVGRLASPLLHPGLVEDS